MSGSKQVLYEDRVRDVQRGVIGGETAQSRLQQGLPVGDPENAYPPGSSGAYGAAGGGAPSTNSKLITAISRA